MQIPEVKLELFRYIDNLNNEELLQMYNSLITKDSIKEKVDFWDTLNDWQKNDVQAGLDDLSEGKKRGFDEVMSKY
jgi:predicted transcriptional regulator